MFYILRDVGIVQAENIDFKLAIELQVESSFSENHDVVRREQMGNHTL